MLPTLEETGYACLLGSSRHSRPCRIGKEIRLALIRLRKAVKDTPTYSLNGVTCIVEPFGETTGQVPLQAAPT